jgi:pyruvate/2-oxoglutarate dehydrogenase complex dihydrolipoamide acyltransferase (E2) component
MEVEVRVPDFEDVDKVTVSFWHVKEGDQVEEGNDLVEVATEKAVFNIAAPCSGILKKQMAKEGDTIKPNEVIAVIQKQ